MVSLWTNWFIAKRNGKVVLKSLYFKKETSLAPHFWINFNLFLIKVVLDWWNSQLSPSSLAITYVMLTKKWLKTAFRVTKIADFLYEKSWFKQNY